MLVRGVDVNFSPYSLFTKVKVKSKKAGQPGAMPVQEVKKEPYIFSIVDES